MNADKTNLLPAFTLCYAMGLQRLLKRHAFVVPFRNVERSSGTRGCS